MAETSKANYTDESAMRCEEWQLPVNIAYLAKLSWSKEKNKSGPSNNCYPLFARAPNPLIGRAAYGALFHSKH